MSIPFGLAGAAPTWIVLAPAPVQDSTIESCKHLSIVNAFPNSGLALISFKAIRNLSRKANEIYSLGTMQNKSESPPPVLRLLIADDHRLVCDILAAHLSASGEFAVDIAHSLAASIDAVRAAGGYDIVLLDLNMPGMNGLEGLATVIDANFGKPVVLLSGEMTAEIAAQAMAMGAASCLSKDMPARSMTNALRFVAAGEVYLPQQFAATTSTEESTVQKLSGREREILRGVCAGKTNREIGLEADISEASVKMHVRAICAKLQARNRTHAAMIARMLKLN